LAIPKYFCWTRFGTESGQSIDCILERKERERVANDGLFLWGIGNAIGPSMKELLRRGADPEILFSPIRSAPKKADVSPAAIASWTMGETLDGAAFPLPDSSTVLSRYNPSAPKRAHYAIVCYSSSPVQLMNSGDTIAVRELRNLLTGRPVGASQVTAVVECDENGAGGTSYPVALRAQLVEPYFVRLVNPLLQDEIPSIS
jgi:hypothetical protein